MNRNRIAAVLVLLLTVSVAGWIRYMPPSGFWTLRPVPAHARVLYQDGLPGGFFTFGPQGPAAGALPDGFVENWSWLQACPLTVATVPLGGLERRDTRVMVSAIGPRSIGLRWRLMLFPPERFRFLRTYAGWPVWDYTDPSMPARARIRFSVADGLLLCAVSDNSHDIFYLLDTLDGRRPSARPKE